MHMRTTATILGLALAVAPAGLAQDQSDPVKVQVEGAMRQVDIGMNAVVRQTFDFVGGQLVGTPVKGAPYSAEAVTETTQTLPDGNRIVNRSSSMLYRDSEGRERREESFNKLGAWNAEGEPTKAIFISDPVAKTSYTLDTKTHTAHKMPSPVLQTVTSGPNSASIQTFVHAERMSSDAAPVIAGRAVGGDVGVNAWYHTFNSEKTPSKTEQLGKMTIEGVQAEGTRTTTTIPAGQIGNEWPIDIVSERWYSAELQMTVLSKNSDPRRGETVYKLTGINRSEPLRSMFEVPADFSVVDMPGMKLRTLKSSEQKQDQF
jgi:hypothetical protein